MSADGPVTLITGAASGIGRATAELLLGRGGRVVALDRSSDALAWADGVEHLLALTGDVTSESDNAAAVASALEVFGRLDGLVLNAGAPASGPIEELDLAAFDACLDVNLRAAVLGLRAALPALRAARGAVVVTASVSGLGGEPGRWPYTAAKAGVINLVRSVAIDVAAGGVRVNAVCPGPIATGMTRRIADGDRSRYEALRRMVPLQRWAEAHEVAEVITFLLSPASSFVTGVALPVDGGISAGSGQMVPPALEAPG